MWGQVHVAMELEDLRDAPCGHVVPFYERESAVVRERNGRHESAHLDRTLPTSVSSHFAATSEAARAARRFVVDELRTRGYGDELVADAALVITELAANVLVHAHSAFTVSVSSKPDGVCISVYDGSCRLPSARGKILTAQSGRGLGLVAGLSAGWGAEPTSDGKVVWAELRP